MQQPATKLPQHHEALDHAPPKVSYQWELLSAIAGEMWPLIVKKSEETFPEHSVRPPDPDWITYVNMQCEGRLHIITARINGVLAGYVVWIISQSLHRKTEMVAITDTYYVKKEYRSGHNIGKEMFKQSIIMLHDLGCKSIIPHSNENFFSDHSGVMDRFFLSLGCKPFGAVYIKE